MLFLETLSPKTLELLRRIQSQTAFAETRLVGGAALALHLGHRTSIDLDLFGSWKPQPPLELALASCAEKVVREGGEERLQFFTVDDVKIDCVSYPYPWLEPAVELAGIRLASLKDIAAMKIAAITNRGTKKDFVDIYFLLNVFSLRQILEFYSAKYADSNLFMVLRSLVYFEDAEELPMPKMLKAAEWGAVKERIKSEVQRLSL